MDVSYILNTAIFRSIVLDIGVGRTLPDSLKLLGERETAGTWWETNIHLHFSQYIHLSVFSSKVNWCYSWIMIMTNIRGLHGGLTFSAVEWFVYILSRQRNLHTVTWHVNLLDVETKMSIWSFFFYRHRFEC